MREDFRNPELDTNKIAENQPVFPDFSKRNSGTTPGSVKGEAESGDTPRDHWEQEKKRLSLALTEQILRGREGVAFSELKKLQLPEMALAILHNHARQLIRRERPLVLQSKLRFELDGAEIREQLRRLRDLLAERIIFEKDELYNALSFYVRLQFDLITKPRSALEKLIYSRSPERSQEDIFIILQGLAENHPFFERIQELLLAYPNGPVTKEAFVALCRRAEKEVYAVPPNAALVADLQAYQNFSTNIGPSPLLRIDNKTVLNMLYERSLHELAESMLPELTRQESWSIPEIVSMLAQHQTSGAVSSSQEKPRHANLPPEVDLATVLHDAATKLENELAVVPQPAKTTAGVAQASLNLEGEEVSEKPRTTKLPPRILYQEETDDHLVVEHAKIEAQPPGPYPSMSQLIDDKSRQAFIKKIFQKDVDAYLDFIEYLEAMQTWKEAKAFLDREFHSRKVNPYSKEAVRLSDLVFSRYFTKSTQ
ncbi:MAG: hypothetical protein ONB44_07495 [candidate division KSB1 bacterium]|nr:hypothetical protein [candidate division KSB1 bacterium]MDZ7301970.1 hypothetical protein [candidate division KSB1 bacterium]MDZ7312375.1 hypothetical protein [candidate division KSB1 bacterium]